MKILFISRAYSKSAGGMERLSYNIIQSSKSHPSLQIQRLTHTGSRKTAPLFSLFIIPKALIKSRNVDFIHIGDPMLSIVGWVIKVILNKKILITVHGLDISYSNILYQLYLRLFFRSFDLYFPISEAVHQELSKHSVKGEIITINPGVSTDYYDPSIPQTELFKIITHNNLNPPPPNTLFLLTTGRLVKRKGHAWFIANVLHRLPSNIHYVIAGHGPELSNIKNIIDRHQMQSRVHILGRVSGKDLKILYNTTNAFIQPNIKVAGDMEGFGLVLLEAAMCNKPVFASNLEGITDAIIPGSNGTLLPSEDDQTWTKALTAFATNPAPTTQSRAFTQNRFSNQAYINNLISSASSIV